MMRVIWLAAALAAWAPAGGAEVVTTTLPLLDDAIAEAAGFGDVNGDGAADLIVETGNRFEEYRRTLRVYFRLEGPTSFAPEPDRILDLTPDVVAYAAGDVLELPGDEIVLFSAGGAYAWNPFVEGGERPRRLIKSDFLWQLPHPREAFYWYSALQDLDRDGLVDLLLPEPGGYRIGFQRRGEEGGADFARESVLRLPPAPAPKPDSPEAKKVQTDANLREIRITLSLGSAGALAGPALSVVDAVPFPVFQDWNADGLPDLLAQTGEELLVWIQDKESGFARDPSSRQLLPLMVDRSRLLDVSFGTIAGELNGDGRADCVVLAGSRQSKEPATQVLVYLHGAGKGRSAQTAEAPLFGPSGIPQQLLVIGGFAGATHIADVNGDGKPDLAVGTVKVDPVDTLRAASSGTLDAQFYVYLNGGGGFSNRPDLDTTIALPVEELGALGGSIMARFLCDVTGNGLYDLLVRDAPERIRIFPMRRSGQKLEVLAEPVFEMRIDERAKLLILWNAPAGSPELLALEKRQIQHVRLR